MRIYAFLIIFFLQYGFPISFANNKIKNLKFESSVSQNDKPLEKKVSQIKLLTRIQLFLRSIDLNQKNLSYKNFSELDLQGIDLSEKILRYTNLTGVILTDADLTGANLTRAILKGADLTRSNLTRAILKGADLTGANLTRSNLTRAILKGADLKDTILTGAYLIDAILEIKLEKDDISNIIEINIEMEESDPTEDDAKIDVKGLDLGNANNDVEGLDLGNTINDVEGLDLGNANNDVEWLDLEWLDLENAINDVEWLDLENAINDVEWLDLENANNDVEWLDLGNANNDVEGLDLGNTINDVEGLDLGNANNDVEWLDLEWLDLENAINDVEWLDLENAINDSLEDFCELISSRTDLRNIDIDIEELRTVLNHVDLGKLGLGSINTESLITSLNHVDISENVLIDFALSYICEISDNRCKTAARDSAGLAPKPEEYKEAVIQIYKAPLCGHPGEIADHTWVATKKENADSYIVYEVLGWRSPNYVVRMAEDIPDRLWYGNQPEILVDLRGSLAKSIIDKVHEAVIDYPYPYEYEILGPNSNTFTAWIACKVPKLNLKLPTRAIGKDYPFGSCDSIENLRRKNSNQDVKNLKIEKSIQKCSNYNNRASFNILDDTSLPTLVANCFAKAITKYLKPFCKQEKKPREKLQKENDPVIQEEIQEELDEIEEEKYDIVNDLYLIADDLVEIISVDTVIGSVESHLEDSGAIIAYFRSKFGESFTNFLDYEIRNTCPNINVRKGYDTYISFKKKISKKNRKKN